MKISRKDLSEHSCEYCGETAESLFNDGINVYVCHNCGNYICENCLQDLREEQGIIEEALVYEPCPECSCELVELDEDYIEDISFEEMFG